MHDGGDHHSGGVISLDLTKLKVLTPLGRGAKGVVFLVRTEKEELLALKAISIEKNEYRRIWFERDVLSCFNHPLFPKLHGVVVTDKIVGYAIDYCSGRDLNSLRKKQTEKMFSDDIIRFYGAELVVALEYLHSLGIVYRDLKPENVMVQENGHLMLVDFDLSAKLAAAKSDSNSDSNSDSDSKRLFHSSPESSSLSYSTESDSVEKSNSFVGTEEYVAPEIILGNGHDFAVDCWCLGVMLYEMLYGATPFRGANRKDTFHRVVTRAPNLTGEQTPLRDLIGKLLEKDPRKRISVGEIKGHGFFRGVDWEFITDLPRPPFIPELTDVEGMEGNKEIDVERYVEEVFKVGDNSQEKRNKDAWDDSNHPTLIQKDNFLIF